ncbi:MAG: hypothetical protein WBA11_12800 [Rubrivirga sp.]
MIASLPFHVDRVGDALEVHLRESRSPQLRGGIVILDLESREGGPGAPPDTPIYHRHPQPWGKVQARVRPPTGCLQSVVLDAAGRHLDGRRPRERSRRRSRL